MIASILTSIDATLCAYMDDFPENLPRATAQAFIATTIIGACLGATIPNAALLGAVAATATLLDAVCRPIFRAIFAPETKATELAAKFLSVGGARLAALHLIASINPWTASVCAATKGFFTVRYAVGACSTLLLNNGIDEKNHAFVNVFT
jgi:hypothetical protein